jgi:hypothetical protein
MPAKDTYHDQAQNSLIKAGGRISHDTYQKPIVFDVEQEVIVQWIG